LRKAPHLEIFMRSQEHRSRFLDLRRVGINREFWYPVARSRQLRKSALLPVTFAGDPIVIARSASGSVFALEDRCAHRQVPLHLGVVQGEQLKCGYHAWCYDRCGKLVKIPYLSDRGKIPPAARGVRAYPCREAYGLVFIYPGDPARAEISPLPDLPESSSAEYRTMHFSRTVECHYSFMHENLMDMNHQFLHRRLMGSIQPMLLDYRAGDTWVEADYKFEGGKQHVGADFMVMGGTGDSNERVDRDYELMTIRTDYPHQGLIVKRSHSDAVAIRLWTAYVPIDAEQRRNRSFGILMIKRPKIPGLLTLAWPIIRYFAESVFTQDRMAVEAEQRAWDAQGGDHNNEVSPVLLRLREVLARCGEAGVQGVDGIGRESIELPLSRVR
jgi:phenylpropionate dioxygenase-like ring-hydroxylating dioxygenase large terminal subunit